MAIQQEKYIHDEMVQTVASVLEKKEFQEVRAFVPGFPSPPEIQLTPGGPSYRPDVHARSGAEVLIEVETAETLKRKESEQHWKAFSEYCRRTSGLFYLVVTQEATEKAEKRLREMDIEAKVLVMLPHQAPQGS